MFMNVNQSPSNRITLGKHISAHEQPCHCTDIVFDEIDILTAGENRFGELVNVW